ncbi:MAG: sodium-dependent transporter [Acidiferrobacterales bacterium]|jgi:NSS family neurotransmitter:Na+ symporter|nr:sodium-dependent transporter [Acidiferrobacterales bacterium]
MPSSRSRIASASDGHWSSELVFVLAVSGAAVGLNNVWQFPSLVAQNGGGAFLLIYFAALLIVGVPLLMTEIVIGRRGEYSPIGSINRLVMEDAAHPAWQGLGWLVTITGFLIFTYLSVVGSWMLAYAVRASVGAFDGLSQDSVVGLFFALAGDPEKQLFWHATFVGATMLIAARGISDGLEPLVKWGVPIVMGSLTLLAIYSAIFGDFMRAVIMLFEPDKSFLTIRSVLIAVGHVLFSLGLGVGAVMAYGAHVRSRVSTGRSALLIAAIDSCAGILAGLFVLSLIYGSGQELSSGPLLLFQSIPYALARLPGGNAVGPIFFLTIALAALLSAVALVEPTISWLRERRGVRRSQAVLTTGLAGWVLGVVSILSFSYWSFSFTVLGLEKKLGVFDILQLLTANLLLPAGGILAAVFVGWVLNRTITKKELGMSGPLVFPLWLRAVRVVVPVLLLIVAFALPSLYK